MLLHTQQYLDIVPFLANQQVGNFRVIQLLQQVEGNVEATKEDPDLLDHIIREIRSWRDEAIADPEHCVAPNLEGCEPWLSLPTPNVASGPVGPSSAQGLGRPASATF